jgi:hypothetical protein
MYPGDPPISWLVVVLRNGEPYDITDLAISAPVYDDGVQVAELTVEKTNPLVGEARLTITSEVFDAVKRYSTWRFREDTDFRCPLIQGRLVKEN